MNVHPISRPLQAVLLGSLVATLTVWLTPDAIEIPQLALQRASGAADKSKHASGEKGEQTGSPSWIRQSTPLPLIEMASAPPPPVKTVMLQPPPEPVAPPQPVVPEPPFRYLGKLVDGNHAQVFLSQNDQTPLVAAVGTTIDGQWRVEQITPSAIDLRYLPSNETRQIFIP